MITYKIDVYIPKDYIDLLIKKLGVEKIMTIENYDYCYTTSKVKGHFMPNDLANNFSGEKNIINEVDEIKLEFRTTENNIKKCIQIIEDIHPYEECVYDIFEIKNFKQ